jgi:hypothetical protein
MVLLANPAACGEGITFIRFSNGVNKRRPESTGNDLVLVATPSVIERTRRDVDR